MKQWLSDGGTIPDDRELVEDLIAPEYDILPGGQVKLETKKEMKKRGLRSPDAADAVALTFAFKVEEYTPLGELKMRSQANGRRGFDPFDCLRRR